MLTFLFAGFILSATSQTAIIAHKSHSGKAVDFFTEPSTNFGIPSPRLVQVIRLNDSTSIEVNDHYNGYYSYDTVCKNPVYANYNLDIDSIKKDNYYHSDVDYINFKKSPKSVKQKSPGYDTKRIDELTPSEIQAEPTEEIAPKKKKKKSAILFIFLVTGGGLLLMRTFNRILTPRVAR
ncbi:hypothetical protein [Fluviicola taffensis]|nr:hypothetical protein [Fluviicola taffensis]